MKMKPLLRVSLALTLSFSAWTVSSAQQTAATSASSSASSVAVVPNLINYSGVLTDLNGKPLSGVQGVTFLLYSSQEGTSPLWMETQNVTAGRNGQYSVTLGSTTSTGVPSDLFANGEARWLGVQVVGQTEQPRVLLVSVPYSMKAGDAQTLGGLPASAFMLATATSSSKAVTAPETKLDASKSDSSIKSNATSDVTTSGGTVNAIPLFSTATNIQNSLVTQTGTTAVSIGGKLNAPAIGTATASAGKNSQPHDFVASVFNSSTSTAVPQTFQLQAEPASNDTTSASGTLNLLYGSGSSTPAETGLKISNKGLLTFATGQTFPGTGKGTITGITTASGSGLSGGGTSGTLTLTIPPAGVSNTMLANSKVTLNANSAGGLTVPGAMTLGSTYTIGLKPCSASQILEYNGSAWSCATSATGTVTSVASGTGLTGGPITGSGTLSINTSQVPLLASANTFTTNQTVNGTLTATSFSGNGANVSNVNAASLGGIAASGYPTLAGINFSTGFSDFDGSEPDWEVEVSNDGGGNGIIASMTSSSANSAGIYADAPNSTTGLGVFGQQGSASGEQSTVSGLGRGIGVWGDGGTTSSGMGIAGSVDDGDAGYFRNNSSSGWQTVWIESDNADAIPFEAFNSSNDSYCYVDTSGDLNCSGSKNAVVPIDGGAKIVAMSAIEAPQNWFEDAGAGELVNGVATITLDRDFTQTVNTEKDYKVFPVPNGDCKGLYVTNKTATSFEVRELGGGTSNVRFDYRIMALRQKYENVRFADHTHEIAQTKAMQLRASKLPLHSNKPGTSQLRSASRAKLAPATSKSEAR
jgi:hypothetical protein